MPISGSSSGLPPVNVGGNSCFAGGGIIGPRFNGAAIAFSSASIALFPFLLLFLFLPWRASLRGGSTSSSTSTRSSSSCSGACRSSSSARWSAAASPGGTRRTLPPTQRLPSPRSPPPPPSSRATADAAAAAVFAARRVIDVELAAPVDMLSLGGLVG
ncbi:hypothetical protein ACP70R_029788 [Stipagrostis hirtigluma subsp. patula]